VAWTKGYLFEEPFIDVRDSEHADAYMAELRREVTPGHPLHGRSWLVIAKALPNDDVIAECDDEVAVVHLTWTQHQEQPPWPLTTFMASVEEFEAYVESEYDWEP
jgi:hypothetical protein